MEKTEWLSVNVRRNRTETNKIQITQAIGFHKHRMLQSFPVHGNHWIKTQPKMWRISFTKFVGNIQIIISQHAIPDTGVGDKRWILNADDIRCHKFSTVTMVTVNRSQNSFASMMHANIFCVSISLSTSVTQDCQRTYDSVNTQCYNHLHVPWQSLDKSSRKCGGLVSTSIKKSCTQFYNHPPPAYSWYSLDTLNRKCGELVSTLKKESVNLHFSKHVSRGRK